MVFPARAGMSPTLHPAVLAALRFPRPRGDEPVPLKYGQETTMFSPPARG